MCSACGSRWWLGWVFFVDPSSTFKIYRDLLGFLCRCRGWGPILSVALRCAKILLLRILLTLPSCNPSLGTTVHTYLESRGMMSQEMEMAQGWGEKRKEINVTSASAWRAWQGKFQGQ